VLCLLAVLLGCTAPPVQGASAGQAPAACPGDAEIKGGHQTFALSLYAAIRGRDGNVSLSPLSISSVLGLAYEGARTTTREQMARVLCFPLDAEEFHHQVSGTRQALGRVSDSSGLRLDMANALWGQQGYRFLDTYQADLERYHASELRQVDFRGMPDSVRIIINTWIRDSTGGIIRDLVKQGMITAETRLVLTNAVYFKGSWAQGFDRRDTKTSSFLTPDGAGVPVDMMERTGDFAYLETPSVKVLDMPYAGDRVSMVVVLPGKKDGLPQVESSLGPSVLTRWMKQLETAPPVQVRVRLPRFTAAGEFDLSRTLAGMGMPSAFTPDADFSGMTGAKRLFIARVIHKALVEVNEEGTEAAAASAAIMTKSVPRVREFLADHPFLFLIRERSTGTILFMGRVAAPRRS